MSAVRDDYVDEVAVERACAGDRSITLNRAEAAEAFRLLDARGLSAREIAEVLGVSTRTTQGWRDGRSNPITRPGATVDNTREKIATALKSEFAPVRRAAAKANQALATLDTVLAEWDAKEAALERVRELEAALAEAKAVLKKPAKAATAPGEHKQARAWAKQQGIEVPDIGRVPVSVLDAWRRATTTAA
jgi:transposase